MSKSKDVARSGVIQAGIVLILGIGISIASLYAQWVTAEQIGYLWFFGILCTVLLGWRFMKRVGGLTGDFLGATQQITELVVLCTVLI